MVSYHQKFVKKKKNTEKKKRKGRKKEREKGEENLAVYGLSDG